MDPKEKLGILRKVARATHGYVPTDLQALCTESAVALISQLASGQSTRPNIDYTYFGRALKTIRPSGMGEFQSKVSTIEQEAMLERGKKNVFEKKRNCRGCLYPCLL